MARIVINHRQCTRCRLCELVCSQRIVNEGFNPKMACIHIVTVGLMDADVPVTCRQCRKMVCAENCPVEAITKNPATGAVQINPEVCIGCGICVDNCPFGAITYPPGSAVPIVCDLCGGQPRCVEVCVSGALTLSDSNQTSEAKQMRFASRLAKSGGEA